MARVTAQLVEADAGKHVWAEHYDRDLAGIFALQDEITEAVTVSIAPAIAVAEQQRAMRKPPESLDAWGAYQRGLWHLSKATAEENALAEKLFSGPSISIRSFREDTQGLPPPSTEQALCF